MKTQLSKPARSKARYTDQYKQEALELWRASGRSAAPCQAAFHTSSGIDKGHQFVVESAMTIFQRTGRYIFLVSVFTLALQVPAVTGQNKKGGVTVSYESSGSSRVARFKNSNSYHVRVEFSYSGTKVHGSAEASGQGAVFVPANYSATYGGHGISITSVRITGVMRSD
jgi:hypothetical protein